MYHKLLDILTRHPKAWPKLVLKNKFEQEIAFNLNRKDCKIWITNNKPKGDGKIVYGMCFCKTDCEPVFYKNTKANTRLGIKFILTMYLKDPAVYAKHYGDAECKCMFCNRPLSNPESILHGYGPICAENFSLPWGFGIKSAIKAQKQSIAIKNKNTQIELEL